MSLGLFQSTSIPFMLQGPGNLIQTGLDNKGEKCAQLTEIRKTLQEFFTTAQWCCQGTSFFWSPFSASEASASHLDLTSLRRQSSCSSPRVLLCTTTWPSRRRSWLAWNRALELLATVEGEYNFANWLRPILTLLLPPGLGWVNSPFPTLPHHGIKWMMGSDSKYIHISLPHF